MHEELSARPLVVPLRARATVDECLAAGLDARALLRAGFSLAELFAACGAAGGGVQPRELREAGASWDDIRGAGFGVKGLLRAELIDWPTLARVWAVSTTSPRAELAALGLTPLEVLGKWTPAESRAAFGLVTPAEAKLGGLAAHQMRGFGFTLLQMCSTTRRRRRTSRSRGVLPGLALPSEGGGAGRGAERFRCTLDEGDTQFARPSQKSRTEFAPKTTLRTGARGLRTTILFLTLLRSAPRAGAAAVAASATAAAHGAAAAAKRAAGCGAAAVK